MHILPCSLSFPSSRSIFPSHSFFSLLSLSLATLLHPFQHHPFTSSPHTHTHAATDAARAAADIVLTEPGLSTIVHGIVISRCIFVRIRNFVTYRIAATLQLLVFFFIAVYAFKPVSFDVILFRLPHIASIPINSFLFNLSLLMLYYLSQLEYMPKDWRNNPPGGYKVNTTSTLHPHYLVTSTHRHRHN